MKILDEGHVYLLEELGEGAQTLRFMKRSGGAVAYEKEWPGLQTQEVLRALIDRTQYLNKIIPCVETQDAAFHLRMALFMYEARAYRRKQGHENRTERVHDDSVRPRAWRELPFGDIPFNEQGIELRPVGNDGHIILP